MFLHLLIAFFSVLLFAFSNPAFAYNGQGTAYPSQSAYKKTVSTQRTDPRMKYFNSRRPNCVRSGSRVCSTKIEADPYIHYVNTIREKEEARQKQLRPWL